MTFVLWRIVSQESSNGSTLKGEWITVETRYAAGWLNCVDVVPVAVPESCLLALKGVAELVVEAQTFVGALAQESVPHAAALGKNSPPKAGPRKEPRLVECSHSDLEKTLPAAAVVGRFEAAP